MENFPTDPENSVLAEADGLVHGDRNRDYHHPAVDYARTVEIFKAWTGIELTPYQGVQFMLAVKMSRMMASPSKRDNYVDLAGYVECLRMVHDATKSVETSNVVIPNGKGGYAVFGTNE